MLQVHIEVAMAAGVEVRSGVFLVEVDVLMEVIKDMGEVGEDMGEVGDGVYRDWKIRIIMAIHIILTTIILTTMKSSRQMCMLSRLCNRQFCHSQWKQLTGITAGIHRGTIPM